MVREVDAVLISREISRLCIQSNRELSPDMEKALGEAVRTETGRLGKWILNNLQDNLETARQQRIPICQDTGMTVIFLEIGQDVHITGKDLTEAVQEGVRDGYIRGRLRKSVVADPIRRENTGDNTPAVIHTTIVPGDRIRVIVAPKGFGSENMSRIFMLKPAQGTDGIREAVLSAVRDAGPNACPPLFIGVGIGGTFEQCALLSKKALLRPVGEEAKDPLVCDLERSMLAEINEMGVGPGGLGGVTTALALHIETYGTHIAGLPVAVNICCHVNRHGEVII